MFQYESKQAFKNINAQNPPGLSGFSQSKMSGKQITESLVINNFKEAAEFPNLLFFGIMATKRLQYAAQASGILGFGPFSSSKFKTGDKDVPDSLDANIIYNLKKQKLIDTSSVAYNISTVNPKLATITLGVDWS